MFNVSVNDKKNIYRSKPVMNVDTVPKPLTYDYMPEGYPKKGIGTVTLMEEQEVTFSKYNSLMTAFSPVTLAIKQGDKLTVVWDGVSYDVVVKELVGPGPGHHVEKVFGNLALINEGESEDYPFIYVTAGSRAKWGTANTATSHTIKVMRQQVKYTPIDVNYMPEGYPKKDGWSVEWDGNIDGKISAVGAPLYKFSDRVLTYEEFLSANYVVDVGGEQHSGMVSETKPMQNQFSDAVSIFEIHSLSFFVVSEDNAEGQGVIFPTKGLYAGDDLVPFKLIKENITPMSTDFLPKNLNVVFRATSLTAVPTSCNVTYNELRGWVENDIPVLAVLNAGRKVCVLGYIIIGEGYIVFSENSGDSALFEYNSDGTFSGAEPG